MLCSFFNNYKVGNELYKKHVSHNGEIVSVIFSCLLEIFSCNLMNRVCKKANLTTKFNVSSLFLALGEFPRNFQPVRTKFYRAGY